MNTAWTLQVVLALVFFGAGGAKLAQPREKLTRTLAWVARTPQPVVTLIGTLELLGALGLVMPALTGVLLWLTPLAAAGLALTMVGAALTNLSIGKPVTSPPTPCCSPPRSSRMDGLCSYRYKGV